MQTGRMGRKIAREQWKAVAVRLALRGYSVRRIAEKIGRARSTVQDALNEALQEASATPEETERRRNEMRARLMRQLEAWAIKSIKGDEKAGAIVVRLEDRLAKLDGLDTQTKVEHELTGPAATPAPITIINEAPKPEDVARLVAAAFGGRVVSGSDGSSGATAGTAGAGAIPEKPPGE